jgi:hypothetical protein
MPRTAVLSVQRAHVQLSSKQMSLPDLAVAVVVHIVLGREGCVRHRLEKL